MQKVGDIIAEGNPKRRQAYIMARILIVDDDKGASDLIEKIVNTAGYETTAVNESYKALEVATNVNPDLIILDLMMPEPTGFQLCRLLRANYNFRFTPIVIVTALDDNDSQVVAFGAGANEYITKPINIERLITVIVELLEQAGIS